VLSVNVADAPFASGPPVQVMVPLSPAGGVAHVNAGDADRIDWNRSDGGSVSFTITSLAASGPLFVAVIV
jgi:hypothetical protein